MHTFYILLIVVVAIIFVFYFLNNLAYISILKDDLSRLQEKKEGLEKNWNKAEEDWLYCHKAKKTTYCLASYESQPKYADNELVITIHHLWHKREYEGETSFGVSTYYCFDLITETGAHVPVMVHRDYCNVIPTESAVAICDVVEEFNKEFHHGDRDEGKYVSKDYKLIVPEGTKFSGKMMKFPESDQA